MGTKAGIINVHHMYDGFYCFRTNSMGVRKRRPMYIAALVPGIFLSCAPLLCQLPPFHQPAWLLISCLKVPYEVYMISSVTLLMMCSHDLLSHHAAPHLHPPPRPGCFQHVRDAGLRARCQAQQAPGRGQSIYRPYVIWRLVCLTFLHFLPMTGAGGAGPAHGAKPSREG